MKASVLPEPVLAAPRMSRPARAWAIVAVWIGVAVINFDDLRALRVNGERGKVEKGVGVVREGRVPVFGIEFLMFEETSFMRESRDRAGVEEAVRVVEVDASPREPRSRFPMLERSVVLDVRFRIMTCSGLFCERE